MTSGLPFPLIPVAPIVVGALGFVLVLVALLFFLRQRKSRQPRHEQLYRQAWEKDPAERTEAEQLCFDAQSLHLYLTAGGLDGGIGNMGEDEVRRALPALKVLGLESVAQEISAFLEIYEAMVGIGDMDQETTDEYFETEKQVHQRIAYDLRDIPNRLDRYLAKVG
ncbi:hypothetical protein [Celeribacter neptunius]|uniref:DUF4375 domain-containing protein n=1 Tax=Celeribacter neptunius TaxID=588602 RepID=A0A1I3RGE1_9RHOB|nr:hypothetical protein [Celeribacter neptunius]SFJ45080.1 hypothetical protein SAMN04487991_2213 [Celeribacter neptunius]